MGTTADEVDTTEMDTTRGKFRLLEPNAARTSDRVITTTVELWSFTTVNTRAITAANSAAALTTERWRDVADELVLDLAEVRMDAADVEHEYEI